MRRAEQTQHELEENQQRKRMENTTDSRIIDTRRTLIYMSTCAATLSCLACHSTISVDGTGDLHYP